MRRRSRRAAPLVCVAEGCGRRIGAKRLCAACFRRLPFEQRKAIAEAGQAHAWHVVAQLVTKASAWLAANPEKAPARPGQDARAAAASALAARICGE